MSRRTGPASPPASAAGSFPSLAAFYNADPVRLRSRERDVGLWWRQEPVDPLHRAAWVCDTGELYLVRLGAPEEGGGTVELLTTVSTPDQLEQLLEGWREHCGEPRSLAWLRGRVRRWTAPRRGRPVSLRPA